ncbi:WD repeat-containing protein 25 isoform X2 [Hemicordylus capensis]|uniref:WD repeat-containing protein 25 isoform X2 n=1 Tax=Hemicordylus capensis TaxID=884348 RepID=UPI0023047EC9|nr:WD repeat-containing protein 25 isoform X2 [Hemicordylus capensis]
MNYSLVAYDDSDSEAEAGKTEDATSSDMNLVNSIQSSVQSHSGKDTISESKIQPVEYMDNSRRNIFQEDVLLQYPQANKNYLVAVNPKKTYSAILKIPNSDCNQSLSPLLKPKRLPGNESFSQKRACSDSDATIQGLRPYIPKRLRQEKNTLLHEAEDHGGSTSCVTKLGTGGDQISIKTSEYIMPYIGSKYRVTEIPKNLVFQMSEHSGPVNAVRWCPVQKWSHMLLSASMDKTVKVIKVYKAAIQQTLDIMFLPEGKEFLTSTDAVSQDSADRTIIAWDFHTAAKISNQIFHERYTCPTLTPHPKESVFVAQTNGNYLALFSSLRPYRINKKKRYEGHKVEGFAVGCEFSPDGMLLATGSSEGKVFFYNYSTARIIRTLSAHSQACVSATFHPVLPSLFATCDWGGEIKIWQ